MKVDFEEALRLLKNEKIVAIPTETVYGLAACYDSKKAIHSIFEHKNRPLDHPLIVHIDSPDWIKKLSINVPSYVNRLVELFWPGPLTLILEKKNVLDLITAGQTSVALRMPNHPLSLKLIEKLAKPIVAPSANKYCKTSPTMAEHVEKNFSSQIPILDGGSCQVGLESTIIQATQEDYVSLVRPGLISASQIEQAISRPCRVIEKNEIKAPGNKLVHYQPKCPIVVFRDKADLPYLASSSTERYYFMCLTELNLGPSRHIIEQMPLHPLEYAKQLYAKWQSFDEGGADKIFIELPPNMDSWQGIRDRILKAQSLP